MDDVRRWIEIWWLRIKAARLERRARLLIPQLRAARLRQETQSRMRLLEVARDAGFQG